MPSARRTPILIARWTLGARKIELACVRIRLGVLDHDFLFRFQAGDAVEKENGDFPLRAVAWASSCSGPRIVLCRRGACAAAVWHYCRNGDRSNGRYDAFNYSDCHQYGYASK